MSLKKLRLGVVVTILLVSVHSDTTELTVSDGPLRYDVRDADSGAPIPCKLTFMGAHGTPTPEFTHNDIGYQVGDAVLAFNRVMSVGGASTVRVPLGTYNVYVSRGPEWDLHIEHNVRIDAAGATVTAKLRKVINTDGWLSADLHVHAARSPDSHVPMIDRVFEFIADGVDVIVSSDHNVVADYQPIIDDLKLADLLGSIRGDEVTTASWGHFGAFPLVAEKTRTGGGGSVLLTHARLASEMFSDIRTRAPGAFIDIHHPRIDNEIGYFNLAHYDATNDTALRPGFSFDFDAVEVLNGYQDAERKSVDHVIDDWFQLLKHGHLVTATGNSDTHHLDHNIGGYPRNYIRVPDDRPGHMLVSDVVGSLRAHHSFFTTAPFIRMHVGRAEMGDLVAVPTGETALELEVDAAPWVDVSDVIVYVGGREWRRLRVESSTNPMRLRATIPIGIERDSFVVVRVDGNRPLSPIVGDLKHFDVRPLALSNPIFFDRDGNGRYDAPYAASKPPKAPRRKRQPETPH